MSGPSMLSQGQGLPPRPFTAAVRPCDTKQAHTMWQLWSKGTNNVTASRAPRQPALPMGGKWIRFFIFLKGLDWACARGQMWRCSRSDFLCHVCCCTTSIKPQIPNKILLTNTCMGKNKKDYLLGRGLQMSLCIFHVDKQTSAHQWISNQSIHVLRDLLTKKQSNTSMCSRKEALNIPDYCTGLSSSTFKWATQDKDKTFGIKDLSTDVHKHQI